MKIDRKRCDGCGEDRVVVTMSADEAEILAGELPDNPSDALGNGEYQLPMMDLFCKRFREAMEAELSQRT